MSENESVGLRNGSTWNSARHSIKRVIFPLLPSPIQFRLDAFHYERRLKRKTLVPEPELSVLSRFVQEGAAVADVGANLGAYTIELSRLVGPAGTVVSFEPVPRTFRLLDHLTRRLAPNPNITLVEAAVGESNRMGEMYIPMEGRLPNFYVASLFPNHKMASRPIPVQVVNLDDYWADIGRPLSFVKMDVEGGELLALHGATRLISRDKPVILCEIGSESFAGSKDVSDVERWLTRHRYQLYQLVDGLLMSCTTVAPLTSSSNYFALPIPT